MNVTAATASAKAWLPRCDVRERHSRVVALPPEEALALALDTPVSADSIVRLLFRLRGLGAPRLTIGEFSSRPPFLLLESTPTAMVFGLATTAVPTPRGAAATAEEWRARTSGIRVAADFRATPLRDGRTRLSTETRVLALDPRSGVLFRAYWLVVGPFSALIRRRWLQAMATRAAQE